MNYIMLAMFSFAMGSIASTIFYRTYFSDRLYDEYNRGYKKAQKDMKEIEDYFK